eukprot:2279305-Lingulodinium_polyedra.AAC.1
MFVGTRRAAFTAQLGPQTNAAARRQFQITGGNRAEKWRGWDALSTHTEPKTNAIARRKL